MEKVLIRDNDYDLARERQSYTYESFDEAEYKRLTDKYIDDLLNEISFEGPSAPSQETETELELEDTPETRRMDKLRTAIGGSAVGMMTRFKESRAEKKARREEQRALKAARKAELKQQRAEKREDETTSQEMKRKALTIGAVAVTPALAYLAAKNIIPQDWIQASGDYIYGVAPNLYDSVSNLASNVAGMANDPELLDVTPGTTEVETHSIEYGASVHDFIVGGNGDPTGEGARMALGGMQGDTIAYPASIAPAGPETMRDSIDQAIPELTKILGEAEANHDEQYNFHGYSLGSVTVAEAANEYVDNGGEINGNVDIKLYGSPLVENTGAFSGGTVETITEVLDEAEIVYDTELPQGADTHSFKTDFWSNAGNAPATSQISMFTGFASDGHHVPIEGQNAVLTGETEMSNGGTSYSYEHIEGPQNPVLRTAEEHVPGFVAEEHPDLTNFVDAVAPIGEVGSPDIPQIDTYEVIDTGAAAIDEAVGVHNLPPVHAEQFVDNVGVENIAPIVEPIVQELNQPIDLSPLNTPEVAEVVRQVQEVSSHLPENFDIGAEVNNIADQAQNFGIEIPRF